ncbi:hypothetical protein EYC80_000879 [Monilinia laxa]|uniref:Uncharacterized protein n=1 Tax=Monilinia laxa TaxID=61186 RepID=A0A5N6K7L3_MONLA|nr:hypothetical protein EYC80_000879 [Monilinia laxa]
MHNSTNVERIRAAADVYFRNKLNAGLYSGYFLYFLENALDINLGYDPLRKEFFLQAMISVLKDMASQGKFDKMTPFLSLKAEKEKEQFRRMMAKKFGVDTKEMAAELRTIADALDETLEFQRLIGGRSRTEDTEDRILSRLADLRFRGEKVDGLLDDTTRLPPPPQQRPASRDTLRRTTRSINLSGMHNGQSDPRAYGRCTTERLPLGRHYSEDDVPIEIARPTSTQPARSRTPQPIRPMTIQPARAMTPQPTPTNNLHFRGSNGRHHSQPPYARSPAHTSIVARCSQERRGSRPPPPQRLYEVPDPPETYSLNVPPELDPNPYYRDQAESPSERVSRRDRVPRATAEERRGRREKREEPDACLNRHETIYQNDSTIIDCEYDSTIIDREYDPDKDEDAESIGSLDHVQPIAPLRIFKPQSRVTWNGTFSG